MKRVVKYKWPKTQNAHKGHNRAHVDEGQTVYAIQDGATGLYFFYAYLNSEIAGRVAQSWVERPGDIEANFRTRPTVVTARTSYDG